MAGLDHKHAALEIREKFSITKEGSRRIAYAVKESGSAGGCVIVSTCNRTELYASVYDHILFEPSRILCGAIGRDFDEFSHYMYEWRGRQAIGHLCRVASGADSQIVGDDQIITQVREALELSRSQNCADSYIETAFKLAVKAAKDIKTNVMAKSLGIDSIPGKTVEMLSSMYALAGMNAVVIGNGQTGRLVAERLIQKNVNVTVTLREYKKGVAQVPRRAAAIGYGDRYAAIGLADIVISATASPHFTIRRSELASLAKLPKTIVDLAVPRDVEPSAAGIPGLNLLTLDDISEEGRAIPPESLLMMEKIIDGYVEKYYKWLAYKNNINVAAFSRN
jgi:glutamyl-tRNA reductase